MVTSPVGMFCLRTSTEPCEPGDAEDRRGTFVPFGALTRALVPPDRLSDLLSVGSMSPAITLLVPGAAFPPASLPFDYANFAAGFKFFSRFLTERDFAALIRP